MLLWKRMHKHWEESKVVTGSGYFQRDKKSLGYSTQEVQGEDLNTRLRGATLLNALFREKLLYTDKRTTT